MLLLKILACLISSILVVMIVIRIRERQDRKTVKRIESNKFDQWLEHHRVENEI